MRTMNIMKFLGFTNRLIRKLLAVYKLVKSLQPAFILQGGGRKSKGKTGGGGGGSYEWDTAGHRSTFGLHLVGASKHLSH